MLLAPVPLVDRLTPDEPDAPVPVTAEPLNPPLIVVLLGETNIWAVGKSGLDAEPIAALAASL